MGLGFSQVNGERPRLSQLTAPLHTYSPKLQALSWAFSPSHIPALPYLPSPSFAIPSLCTCHLLPASLPGLSPQDDSQGLRMCWLFSHPSSVPKLQQDPSPCPSWWSPPDLAHSTSCSSAKPLLLLWDPHCEGVNRQEQCTGGSVGLPQLKRLRSGTQGSGFSVPLPRPSTEQE